MRVLLTGGTGFIGPRLVNYLLGNELSVQIELVSVGRTDPGIESANFRWIKADLADPEFDRRLPDSDFDIVLHFAQSRDYRLFPDGAADMTAINVTATQKLADWSVKHGVQRFVYSSTGNVYSSSLEVLSETSACVPAGFYGASKLAAELLLRPFAQFFDVVVLRLFGVYGAGQTQALFPGIVDRFLNEQEIQLAQNVGVQINPLHIDDFNKLLATILTHEFPERWSLFNVAGDESVDLAKAVRLLERETGMKANVSTPDSSPTVLLGAVQKLKSELDYSCYTTFEKGFTDLIKDRQRQGR